MDVFLSWSGKKSRAVAAALHFHLPQIINQLDPWKSDTDIDKGARWADEIAARLESCKAGIICLTRSNLRSEWIHYEAGALSKTVGKTRVCTLLADVAPSQVTEPLKQFQATRIERSEFLQLIRTLNGALGENALAERRIDEAFPNWWSGLERTLRKLPDDDDGRKPNVLEFRPEVAERNVFAEALSDGILKYHRTLPADIVRSMIATSKVIKFLKTFFQADEWIESSLRDALNNGGRVELFLCDPNSKVLNERCASLKESPSEGRTRIIRAVQKMREFASDRTTSKPRVTVTLYDGWPGAPLLLCDNRILVGLYLRGTRSFGGPWVQVRRGSPLRESRLGGILEGQFTDFAKQNDIVEVLKTRSEFDRWLAKFAGISPSPIQSLSS